MYASMLLLLSYIPLISSWIVFFKDSKAFSFYVIDLPPAIPPRIEASSKKRENFPVNKITTIVSYSIILSTSIDSNESIKQ